MACGGDDLLPSGNKGDYDFGIDVCGLATQGSRGRHDSSTQRPPVMVCMVPSSVIVSLRPRPAGFGIARTSQRLLLLRHASFWSANRATYEGSWIRQSRDSSCQLGPFHNAPSQHYSGPSLSGRLLISEVAKAFSGTLTRDFLRTKEDE
jgi:hypothetical protein